MDQRGVAFSSTRQQNIGRDTCYLFQMSQIPQIKWNDFYQPSESANSHLRRSNEDNQFTYSVHRRVVSIRIDNK
jgi:hypothetical protein